LERSAERALLKVEQVQEAILMLQRGEISKKVAVRPKPVQGGAVVVEAKAAEVELPELNQWGGQGLGKAPSSKARVPEGPVEGGSKPAPRGKQGGKRCREGDIAESSNKKPKPAGKRAAQPRTTRASAQVNLSDLPGDES
jgi:hypothetical protein